MSMPTSTGEAERVGTKDWWNSSIAAQSMTTIKEKKDHRQFHDAVEPPRRARNPNRPRIKYSVTWPAFLINVWIQAASSDEIPGIRKGRIFSTKRDVFSAENVSVENQNIKDIHKITGSQYLPKF